MPQSKQKLAKNKNAKSKEPYLAHPKSLKNKTSPLPGHPECKTLFPSPKRPIFQFIDLFSGIGGFRIALQNLGGRCVFSSEIDKYAQQTYHLNFGEVPFGDITKIDEKSIPDHDILCAGFPCQAFSDRWQKKRISR